MLIESAALAGDDAAKASAWRPLFQGQPLDPASWKQVGGGRFVFEKGILRTECTKDGLGLLLFTKEMFGDCRLKVVYRCDNARDNSGVFVRIAADPEGKQRQAPDANMELASDREQAAWFAVHNGYEVQICDAADPFHRTGAIYSFTQAQAAPPAVTAAWRTMIITLEGERVTVELDGKPISSFDPTRDPIPPRTKWYEPKREPKRPTKGYIGLQTHDPGDVVYFKEVSVQPLEKSTANAPPKD